MEPTTTKRKVISLIRVSSTGQAKDDRTGIPRQMEDIEIHCRTCNLEVVKEYRFEGLSGAHVQQSTRFGEMLAELSRPSIAGVVFATLDRFFRPEQLSSFVVFEPFETTGKRLFCDLGELDLTNAADRMKIMIFGQMAGFDRERIKSNMGRGKAKNRLRPDVKSDPLPDGVAPPDKQTGLFAYTPRSERVKQAMARVLVRDSFSSIATDLGWKSTTALRATHKSYWWIGVKASLNCRGKRKWNAVRDEMAEGKKVARKTENGEPAPIMVDTNLAASPLVSRETFFAVQDILAQNRTTWTQRKSRVNNFLCSGILYCRCGKKMYHKTDKRPGKPNYYLCSSNSNRQNPCGHSMIDASRVDREVWVHIRLYTKSEKYLAEQIAVVMNEQNTGDIERTVQDIERTLKGLEKEEKSIVEAIRFMGFNASLGEQMKDITLKRSELKAKLVVTKCQVFDKNTVNPKSIASQIKARFWTTQQTDAERKALLAEMVERIVVITEPDEESVSVRFRVPDSIMPTRTDRGSLRPPA